MFALWPIADWDQMPSVTSSRYRRSRDSRHMGLAGSRVGRSAIADPQLTDVLTVERSEHRFRWSLGQVEDRLGEVSLAGDESGS